ncbi:MFS transporter, partial [Nocardia cyriacigeorgica]
MFDLPDWFPDWLVDMVVGHIPEGDPDAMRAAAEYWRNTAKELTELGISIDEIGRHGSDLGISGEYADQLREWYRECGTDTKELCLDLEARAKDLDDGALKIEHHIYLVQSIAFVLIGMILIDLTRPHPATVLVMMQRRLAARQAMTLSLRNLVTMLRLANAKFAVALPRLALVTKGTVMGGAIGGGTQVYAMGRQMVEGNRDAMDWEQVKIGAGAGAVGGAFGAAAGGAIAHKVMGLGAHAASTTTRKALQVLGIVAAGAGGGVVGGYAGAKTAEWLSGRELTDKEMAAMIWTGLGSGIVGSVGAAIRAGRTPPPGSSPTGAPAGPSPSSSSSTRSAGPPPRLRSSVTGSDGQAPRPRDMSPEGQIRELGRELAGRMSSEDLPSGPHRDLVADFVDSQNTSGGPRSFRESSVAEFQQRADAHYRQQLAEMGIGEAPGPRPLGGDAPGTAPGQRNSPGAPESGGSGPGHSTPVPHGGSGPSQGSATGVRESAPPPTRAVSTASDGAGTPNASANGPTAQTGPRGGTESSQPTRNVTTTSEGTGRVSAPRDVAPPPSTQGSEPGHARALPESGSGDGTPVRGTGDAPGTAAPETVPTPEPAGLSGDSPTNPVRESTEPSPVSPSTAHGDSTSPSAHEVPAGLRNCAPEVASHMKETTGYDGINTSLIDSQEARLRGVTVEQYAEALGGHWRTFESPQALVDYVANNNAKVAGGLQFKDGAGAHAAAFSRNSLGRIEIHEQVGNIRRRTSGDLVIEWTVDAQGKQTGPDRVRIEDNAVENWLRKISPHVKETLGVVFLETAPDSGRWRPQLELAPGEAAQQKPGWDRLSGTDLLERGAPAPDSTTETPPINREQFEAAFQRDLERLGVMTAEEPDAPTAMGHLSGDASSTMTAEPVPRSAGDTNNLGTRDTGTQTPRDTSTPTARDADNPLPRDAGTSRAPDTSAHATRDSSMPASRDTGLQTPRDTGTQASRDTQAPATRPTGPAETPPQPQSTPAPRASATAAETTSTVPAAKPSATQSPSQTPDTPATVPPRAADATATAPQVQPKAPPETTGSSSIGSDTGTTRSTAPDTSPVPEAVPGTPAPNATDPAVAASALPSPTAEPQATASTSTSEVSSPSSPAAGAQPPAHAPSASSSLTPSAATAAAAPPSQSTAAQQLPGSTGPSTADPIRAASPRAAHAPAAPSTDPSSVPGLIPPSAALSTAPPTAGPLPQASTASQLPATNRTPVDDDLPDEPEEFIPPKPSTVEFPTGTDATTPRIPGFPLGDPPEEFKLPPPAIYTNPAFPLPPEEDTRNRTPIIPRPRESGSLDSWSNRPRFTPDGDQEEHDPTSPLTPEPAVGPEITPIPRPQAAPSTSLDASPTTVPMDAGLGRKYPTDFDESAPGAPGKPGGRPGLNPDSLEYLDSPGVETTQGGVSGATLAPPPPPKIKTRRPVLSTPGTRHNIRGTNPFPFAPAEDPWWDEVDLAQHTKDLAKAIAEHNAELDEIAENPEEPDVDNTLHRFAESGSEYRRLAEQQILKRDKEDRNSVAEQVDNLITGMKARHDREVLTNKKLFERVEKLYFQRDELELEPGTKDYLQRLYQDFRHAGVNLPFDGRSALAAVDAKLADLVDEYQNNLVQAIADAARHGLSGLDPEQAALAAADAAGMIDYILQLPNRPSGSQQPFWSFADTGPTVQLLYQAAQRLGSGGRYDNSELTVELMRLLADRAQIVGETHDPNHVAGYTPISPEHRFAILSRLIPAGAEDITPERLVATMEHAVADLLAAVSEFGNTAENTPYHLESAAFTFDRADRIARYLLQSDDYAGRYPDLAPIALTLSAMKAELLNGIHTKLAEPELATAAQEYLDRLIQKWQPEPALPAPEPPAPTTSRRPTRSGAPSAYPGTMDAGLDTGRTTQDGMGAQPHMPFSKGGPAEGYMAFHTPPGGEHGVGRGTENSVQGNKQSSDTSPARSDTPRLTPEQQTELIKASLPNGLADTVNAVGWHETLTTGLRRALLEGTISEGRKLAPAKVLAEELGTKSQIQISPDTVAKAYRELADAGYLVSRGRAGTTVTSKDHWPKGAPAETPIPLSAAEQKELIDAALPGGLADTAARTSWQAAVAGGLRQAILGGSIPEGQRLSPIDKLADELGTSSWSVSRAYNQLDEEGYLQVRPPIGTAVTSSDRWPSEAPPAPEVDRPPTEVPVQRGLHFASYAPESVRSLLADSPLESHTAAAEEMLATLLSTAEGPAAVRTTKGGQADAQWLIVEVIDDSRIAPVRDKPDPDTGVITPTETGRLLELLDEKSRTWGVELFKNGDRSRWFTLATPAVPDGPLQPLGEPAIDLSFTRAEVFPGGGSVRRAFVELLDRKGWPEGQLEEIRLTVTEVFGNISRYARAGGAQVQAWMSDAGDELVVNISDTSRVVPGWKLSEVGAPKEVVDTTPPGQVDAEAQAQLLAMIDIDTLMAGDGDLTGLNTAMADGTHERGGDIIMKLATSMGYELAPHGAPGKSIVMKFRMEPPEPSTAAVDDRSPTAPATSPGSSTPHPAVKAAGPPPADNPAPDTTTQPIAADPAQAALDEPAPVVINQRNESHAAEPARSLRVATWNIAGGRRLRSPDDHGEDGNTAIPFDYSGIDVAYFAEQLRHIDADVIVVQESEVGPDGSTAQELAALLGYQYVYETVMSPSHMDTRKLLSLAVISRLPIDEANGYKLPGVTTVELRINGQVVAPHDRFAQVVEIGGITVVNTHPTPLGFFGHSYEDGGGAVHAEEIGQLLRALATGPTVLAADLNTDRPHVVYQQTFDAMGMSPALTPDARTVPGWDGAPDQVLTSPEFDVAESGISHTDTDHWLVYTHLAVSDQQVVASLADARGSDESAPLTRLEVTVNAGAAPHPQARDVVRAMLARSPLESQTAAAEEMVEALLSIADGPATVRATSGGQADAQWVIVEVTDQNRSVPTRDTPDPDTGIVTHTDTGRVLELLDAKARTWGIELDEDGDRTLRFTLATPAIPVWSLQDLGDPVVDLVFDPDEIAVGGGTVDRSFVDLLEGLGWPAAQVEMVRRMVSEHFGNAARYASEGTAWVEAWMPGSRRDELVVRISDSSREVPAWTLMALDESTAEQVSGIPEHGDAISMKGATSIGYELSAYGEPGKSIELKFRMNPPEQTLPASDTRREVVGDLRMEAVDCLVRASNALGHLDLFRGNIPASDDPRWAALATSVTDQPATTWDQVVADLLASTTADTALVYVEGPARHHALALTRFDLPAGPEIVVFDGRLAGAHELSAWEALALEGGAHRGAPTRAVLFSMNDEDQMGPDLSGLASETPQGGKPVEGALSHLPGDEPSKSFWQWLREHGPKKPANQELASQARNSITTSIADSAVMVALPLTLRESGVPLDEIALAMTVPQVAALITQTLMGPVTDRGDNRTALQAASGITAVSMLGAGGWVLFDLHGAPIALISAATAASIAKAVIDNAGPAYRKKLSNTPEDEAATRRYNVIQNALASAVGKAAGPVAGPFALGVSAVLHLKNLAVLKKLPAMPPDEQNSNDEDPKKRSGVLDGPRHMFRDRFIKYFLVLTPPSVLGAEVGTILLVDIITQGDYSVAVQGLLASGIATGMVATKLLVPEKLVERAKIGLTYPISMATSAGLLLAYANTSNPYALLGAMAAVGSSNYVNNIAYQAHQHRVIPDNALGGASSALGIFGSVGRIGAGLTIAAALPVLGNYSVAMGAAGLFGLTTLGAAALGYSIRNQTYETPAIGDESAEDAENGNPTIGYGALQLAQIFHALGLGGAPEPDPTAPHWDTDDNWKPLEATLGAQLRPVSTEGDPVARVVEAVRTRGNGIDSAFMSIRQGTKVSDLAVINVEGNTLLFGLPAEGSDAEIDIPRIRTVSEGEGTQKIWPAPGNIDEAFVAFYAIDSQGNPVPRDLGLRARANTRHPAKMPNHSADDRRTEQIERYLEGLDGRLAELNEEAHLPQPLEESDEAWQARFDAEIERTESAAREAARVVREALAAPPAIPIDTNAAPRRVIYTPSSSSESFQMLPDGDRQRFGPVVTYHREIKPMAAAGPSDGTAPHQPPAWPVPAPVVMGDASVPQQDPWNVFGVDPHRRMRSDDWQAPTVAAPPHRFDPSVWFAGETGRPGVFTGNGPEEPRRSGTDIPTRLFGKVDEARDHGHGRRADANSEAEELATLQGLEPPQLIDPAVLDTLRASHAQAAADLAHRLNIDPSAVGPWIHGLVPYLDLDGAPDGDRLSDAAQKYADLDALLTAIQHVDDVDTLLDQLEQTLESWRAVDARLRDIRDEIADAAEAALEAAGVVSPIRTDPVRAGRLNQYATERQLLSEHLEDIADRLLLQRPEPRPLLPEDWRGEDVDLALLADDAWTKLATIRGQSWQVSGFLGEVVQGAKAFDALNREQKWSLVGDLKHDRYGIPARWRNRVARLALLDDKQSDDAEKSRRQAEANDEFDSIALELQRDVSPDIDPRRASLATALIGLAAAEHQVAELPGHPHVHLFDRYTENFGGPPHIAMAIGDVDAADEVRVRIFSDGITPALMLEAVDRATADLAEAESTPGRRVASVILLTEPAPIDNAANLVKEYVLGFIGTREHYSSQPGGRPQLTKVGLHAGDAPAEAIVRQAEQDPELAGRISEPAGPSTDLTPHTDGSAGFRIHDRPVVPRDDGALDLLLEGEYVKDCATQVVGELARGGLPLGLPGRPGEHGEMFAPEFSRETGARFEPSGFVGDNERTARDKVADRLTELGTGARVALVVRRPARVGAHMTLWKIDEDGVVWEREVRGYDPTEQPLTYRPREVRWTRYERGTPDEPGAEYFGTSYRQEEHAKVGTILRPVLPYDPNDPGDPSADFPMDPIGALPGNDQPVAPVGVPPAALRSLANAQSDAEEVVRAALRPVNGLGIDTAHLIGKSTEEIADALNGIVTDTRRGRMDGALRRLVIDGVIARVLAEDAEFPTATDLFGVLREHIDEWHRYVDEIRNVLPILAARQVLAAEGATIVDEGIGLLPDPESGIGERVVVVSPMLGQIRLLNTLDPEFRWKAAEIGIPVEYRHVRIDDDGQVRVEQISGSSLEPLWGIGYYISAEHRLWLNSLVDERPFAEKLAEAENSGVSERRVLKGGGTNTTMSEQVVLVVYENGFHAVEKTVREVDHADAEELATLLLHAVGVHAPGLVRRGLVLLTEYVPGVVSNPIGKDNWQSYRDLPDAQRFGLGEVLTRPWDRYEGGNLGIDHGVRIIPIDHSNAFTDRWPVPGFADTFVEWRNDGRQHRQHSFPQAELAEIHSRIAALESDFTRLNRTTWFEGVMSRLEVVQNSFEDDTGPRSLTLPEVIEELERLRNELAERFELPVAEDAEATPRQWHEAANDLRRELASRNDRQELADVDRFDDLNKLLVAAYLLQTRAMELLETDDVWPGLMDAYLDTLTLRLADLAEGGRYPLPNNESDAEWQARFDREIRPAEAERARAQNRHEQTAEHSDLNQEANHLAPDRHTLVAKPTRAVGPDGHNPFVFNRFNEGIPDPQPRNEPGKHGDARKPGPESRPASPAAGSEPSPTPPPGQPLGAGTHSGQQLEVPEPATPPTAADNSSAEPTTEVGEPITSLWKLVRDDSKVGMRFGSEFLNATGSSVMVVALDQWLMENSGPLVASIVGALANAPAFAGAPIAGWLTDHFQPRKLMWGSAFVGAGTAAIATGALASGTSYTVPILIVTTFVEASASVVYGNASAKVLNKMAGDAQDGLSRYNNLKQNVSRVFSRLAAPVALEIGTFVAPLFNLGTNVVNLATMPGVPELQTEPRSNTFREQIRDVIVVGPRTIYGDHMLRYINNAHAFTNLYLGMQGGQFTMLLVNSGLSGTEMGLVGTLVPTGAVLGNFVRTKWTENIRIKTLSTMRLAALAATAAVPAVTDDLWLTSGALGAGWAVIGATSIPIGTYSRRKTPVEVLGQANATRSMTMSGGVALGGLASGGALELWGQGPAGTALAVGAGAVGAWTVLQRLFGRHKARTVLDCINQTTQATWAFGLDHGTKLKRGENKPKHLANAIGAQLVELPHDGDPRAAISAYLDTIADSDSPVDSTVFLYDYGKKKGMHSAVATNIGNGNLLIADTNIKRPKGVLQDDPDDPDRIPRVRIRTPIHTRTPGDTHEEYELPYADDIEKIYVAELTTDDNGNLTNLHPVDPDAPAPRKKGKVKGRPNGDENSSIDPSVAGLLDVLDESRVRSARNGISLEFAHNAVAPNASRQLIESRQLLDELLDHIRRPETADPRRFQLLTHLYHAVEAWHATAVHERHAIEGRISHLRETLRPSTDQDPIGSPYPSTAEGGTTLPERVLFESKKSSTDYASRLQYGREIWGEVVPQLTDAELAAMRPYAIDPFGHESIVQLNEALRGERELTPELTQTLAAINAVLARRPLPEPMVVSTTLPAYLVDMANGPIEPGTEFQLRELSLAMTGVSPPLLGVRFKVVLTVPPGTPTFPLFVLPSAPAILPFQFLPNGLTIRIDRTRDMGDDHWLLHATVVAGPTTPVGAKADVATPTAVANAAPRPLDATHQELHDWAASLSDAERQRLIIDLTAEITSHVDAFQRGDQPPAASAIGAARLLNAALWEESHNFHAHTHSGSIADYSTLFQTARDLANRIPEAEALHSAANALFNLAGTFPLGTSLAPESFATPYHELNFLDSLPMHLGRMADLMTKAVHATPWSGESSLPSNALPAPAHVKPIIDAIDQIHGLDRHFEMQTTEGTDWSIYFDRYLASNSVNGFDADVSQAIRSLHSTSEQNHPEIDRSFLQNILTLTKYYLTRTLQHEAAFDLSQKMDRAFATAAYQYPDATSLNNAAKIVHFLHKSIVGRKNDPEKFTYPLTMRNFVFTHLVQYTKFNSLLERAVGELHHGQPTGSPWAAVDVTPVNSAPAPIDLPEAGAPASPSEEATSEPVSAQAVFSDTSTQMPAAPGDHSTKAQGPIAAVSDLGVGPEHGGRDSNEDAFGFVTVTVDGEPVQLAAVADGVGGSARGGEAAQTAVRAAITGMSKASADLGATGQFDPLRVVRRGMSAARAAVGGLAETPGQANSPDSTVALAVMQAGTLVIDSAGDTRVYWLPVDGGTPVQLSVDDTIVPMLIADGMPEGEALQHSFAGQTTRSLGRPIPDDAQSHATKIPVQGRGYVLIATDGVWHDTYQPDDLAAIVRQAHEQSPGDHRAVAAGKLPLAAGSLLYQKEPLGALVVDIPDQYACRAVTAPHA